jgi:hypothetical protein
MNKEKLEEIANNFFAELQKESDGNVKNIVVTFKDDESPLKKDALEKMSNFASRPAVPKAGGCIYIPGYGLWCG